jgi:SAM-dependent methyltransferase
LSEWLQFGSCQPGHSPMDIAEHLTRYSMLRSICVGKRVLDVACGEGFGSYLMAQWGAASVTGIDISPDAVAVARSMFAAHNVTYLEGDVCRLPELLSSDSLFDIICSFETIEHLANPKSFLRGLAKVRARECVIAISAPNDHILPAGVSNPFHLQRFDLDSLRAVTEAALGPAGGWLLGAPFQGFLVAPERGFESGAVESDVRRSLHLKTYATLDLIPPQQGDGAAADNAHFWVGVWGASCLAAAVGAAQSMTSWQEPWRALEYFKDRETYFEDREFHFEDRELHFEEREKNFGEREKHYEVQEKQFNEVKSYFEKREKHYEEQEKQFKERQAQLEGEIRALSLKLAEERRAGVIVRGQLDELKLRGTKLSDDAIRAVAGEVWRERRRRRLTSKIRRWFKRKRP